MRWPDLPPLGTLATFEAVVRLGSTTRAGAERHLTHSAVSRQIAQLERAVGVPLFRRDPRAMVPTPAALALAEAVTSALTLLDGAARAVHPGTARRPLTLSCEPTLLTRWLIPRLGALAQDLPEVELHLAAGGGPIDLRSGSVDVALRRDDFPVPAGPQAVELFVERTGPVASPAPKGPDPTVEDLAAMPRLHSATRPDAWPKWAARRALVLPSVPERTFEHFSHSLQAAAAGLGAAIGPIALVHDDLMDRRLVAPAGLDADGSRYVLLIAPHSISDVRAHDLAAWLRHEGEQLCAN